ncbi:MAG: hypothetical protein NTW99_00240 [Chloroflexi bacterium]|nr:hypothetical protein [Chloroflexota bacterium]
MLDNLRDQASFQEEEEPLDPNAPKPRRSFDQIIGMTAPQRFTLAVMLLIIVSLLGAMFLLISGKIVLPLIF